MPLFTVVMAWTCSNRSCRRRRHLWAQAVKAKSKEAARQAVKLAIYGSDGEPDAGESAVVRGRVSVPRTV